MVVWNLGSVAEQVLLRVEDVPVTISGAPLMQMADEQRIFVEEYTGLSIGSVDIAERFQGVLVDLTCAKTLGFMQATGVDANSITLGEFSISKGQGGNLDVMAKYFKAEATDKLNAIGKKMRVGKTDG